MRSSDNQREEFAASRQKEPAEVIRVIKIPPWRLPLMIYSGLVQPGGDPGVDPELSEGITYLIWPGNASGVLRRKWKMLFGRKTSVCYDLIVDKLISV